jgi:hypothetical protein
LLKKNFDFIECEAKLSKLAETVHIKSKNPIIYKINGNSRTLFEVIKKNLNEFLEKILKSTKFVMVRPSFEHKFNSEFNKIMDKLSKNFKDANNSVPSTANSNKNSFISLKSSEISLLEEEIRQMSQSDLKPEQEIEMTLPEHVLQLEKELGPFVVPRNLKIVNPKFVNLVYHKGVKLEDGSFYDGQWSKEGTRTGRGKCLFADGLFYDGFWIDGKPQLFGRFIKPNKDLYEGLIKDGKANGKGILFNPTGYRYVGFWKDNMKEGQGEEIFEEKGSYQGSFKNDVHHGKGIN